MIGIIGAMKPEIDGIKGIIENKEIRVISGIEFVSGTIGGSEVVAAVCGIGKVFAAICAEAMILNYHPDTVINIGVAGTLTNDLSIGDIAIAGAVVQHDMDTSELGDPLGLISGFNIIEIPCCGETVKKIERSVAALNINSKIGIIASGDQFIGGGEKKNFIKEHFGAIACEMEGGSVGQVCFANGVDFCVIRAISDGADGGAKMDYPAFMEMAAENSIKVMKGFLKM